MPCRYHASERKLITVNDDEGEGARVRREMEELEVEDPLNGSHSSSSSSSSWTKRIGFSLPQWRWRWRLPRLTVRLPRATDNAPDNDDDSTQRRTRWRLPDFNNSAALLMVGRLLAVFLDRPHWNFPGARVHCCVGIGGYGGLAAFSLQATEASGRGGIRIDVHTEVSLSPEEDQPGAALRALLSVPLFSQSRALWISGGGMDARLRDTLPGLLPALAAALSSVRELYVVNEESVIAAGFIILATLIGKVRVASLYPCP